MADGEDRSTVRPLRPATPPDDLGVARPAVPRPRRSPLKPSTPPVAADAGSGPPDAGSGSAVARTEPAGSPTAPETASVATAPEAAGSPTAPEAASPPTAPEAAGVATVPEAAGSPTAPEAPGSPTAPKAVGVAPAAAAAGGRRRRIPFAHAVPVPARRLALGAGRATRAWSGRPSGRATLAGLFLLLLVGVTAAAGALLVPATAGRQVAADATVTTPVGIPTGNALPPATAAPPPVAAPPATAVPPGASGPAGLPGATVPSGTPQPTGTVVGQPATGRPADALAIWAQQVGARTDISPVAMQAYGYAELVLAQTHRSCQLSWTTLAAIGYVESRHGQANGATLKSTGRAEPEIIGDPLDGQGGRSLIRDTDRGALDRDTTYDRAIGPMQFIPTTWEQVGADADNDGQRDPHNINDAALAAGNYLCQGGRNMTIAGDWWGAILSYNDVRRYAQDVFDKANEYGRASRT
ncbi:lytic murein transglycosylase [Micromonospora sp. PLK6-60]|nr:lytic transglycosylase domain-containing protein [Micromonospora sp. PLK6-60]MBY8872955.1 lytic murein transglycosylase [Micromonospora sp. PLK6-60]